MNLLVVGAGPTGLSLALAARRRGLTCRLIDAAPAPAPESRALAVQARTLEVFERLGVADRALAEARPITGATFHLGRELRVDFRHVHPRLPSLVSLPQALTERLLLEAGAAPERPVRFVGLEGEAARLRHADGREEICAADWIVGCDGAHSAVRHALGARFTGAQYDEHLVLVDAPLEGLEQDRVHAFPGGPGTRAFIPLPGELWRAIAVLPADGDAPEDGSLRPFATDGVRFGTPSWWSTFRISRRMVERLRFGRVLLAGDAAHIHSPVGGQGMNLGVQDAFALAAALAEGEDAVDRWAAERHAIARRVLRATDLATRLMFGRGATAGPLRGAALRAIAGMPFLARRMETALAGLDYPAPPA